MNAWAPFDTSEAVKKSDKCRHCTLINSICYKSRIDFFSILSQLLKGEQSFERIWYNRPEFMLPPSSYVAPA